MKGLLISTQTLILGHEARVEGQIEGNHVVISGHFDGVIFAKGKVEIHDKGIATGEIHTHCLVIEPGGVFDGQCHMLAESEATKTVTIPIRRPKPDNATSQAQDISTTTDVASLLTV